MKRKIQFDDLLHEDNMELHNLIEDEVKTLLHSWFNDNKETIENILSDYEYDLDFIEDINNTHDKNLISLGMLNGMVECLSILHRERVYDDAAISIGMMEKHAIKHYDEVVLELSGSGLLNHSELCERLQLKDSTLSELMKKILPSGQFDVVKLGKYKYYSLTDSGRRYARQLKKQIQADSKVEENITEIIAANDGYSKADVAARLLGYIRNSKGNVTNKSKTEQNMIGDEYYIGVGTQYIPMAATKNIEKKKNNSISAAVIMRNYDFSKKFVSNDNGQIEKEGIIDNNSEKKQEKINQYYGNKQICCSM